MKTTKKPSPETPAPRDSCPPHISRALTFPRLLLLLTLACWIPCAIPSHAQPAFMGTVAHRTTDGYAVLLPEFLNDWRVSLVDLPAMSDPNVRRTRYRQALIAVLLQPDLQERMKPELRPQLVDLGSQLSQAFGPGSTVADLLSAFGSDEYERLFKVALSDLDFRELARASKVAGWAESMDLAGKALSVVSLSGQIEANVAQDIFYQTLSDQRAFERLECLESFMRDTGVHDPAFAAALNDVQNDLQDLVRRRDQALLGILATTWSSSFDPVTGALVEAAFDDAIKVAFQSAGIGSLGALAFGLEIKLAADILWAEKDAIEVTEAASLAVTFLSDFNHWSQSIVLPPPSSPDYVMAYRKKLVADELNYATGFWYFWVMDRYLDPCPSFSAFCLPNFGADFLEEFVSGFDRHHYRTTILQPMRELNYSGALALTRELSLPISIQESPQQVSLRPLAQIISISPSTVASGATNVTFTATGQDLDSIGQAPDIRGYRWTSTVGTTAGLAQLYPSNSSGFGLDSSFTMRADTLRVGTHTAKLQVLDNDGEVSDFATAILVITQPGPPPTGVFLSSGTVESPILAGNDARYSVVYQNTTGAAPDQKWVIIDGTKFNLLPGSGNYIEGKTYYFGKTFSSSGSGHTYHFEFMAGGTSYRFPTSGELSGPVVTSPGDDLLVNGYVTPTSGAPSDTYTYYVTYKNPSGVGPTYDVVALFADGALDGINMSRVQAGSQNWAGGVTYRTFVTGLPAGSHSFHFSCAVGGSTHNVRLPSTGQFPGPTVGEPGRLSITITPINAPGGTPVSNFNVGDAAWFRVLVRNQSGQLVDPETWRLMRANDGLMLYANGYCAPPFCGTTGVGTFEFNDYHLPSLPGGFYVYRMDVTLAGYPPASDSIELSVGSQPPQPIRISNVSVSPPSFRPGIQTAALRYDVSAASHMVIRVVTTNGSVVRTLVGPDAARDAGSYVETWDGRNDQGGVVPEADYLFRTTATKDITGLGDNALEYVSEMGDAGTGFSQLDEVVDLVFDSRHNMVIAAQWYFNAALKRYTPSGAHDGNFTLCGSDNRPIGIAQDAQGSFYELDHHGRIWRYGQDYTCQGMIADLGSGSSPDSPSAIATDGDSYLYLADYSTERLYRMNLDGSGRISIPYSFANRTYRASGVAVDKYRRVWVAFAHWQSNQPIRIYCYDANLNYLREIDPGVSESYADVDVKSGSLLYVRSEYQLKVYDIENNSWLPINKIIDRDSNFENGIDAVEDGYTYVLGDPRSPDSFRRNIARYRDHISTDSRSAPVRATPQIPKADITWPTNGLSLESASAVPLVVTGSAFATQFSRYTLEAGPGLFPTNWTLITNATTMVTNGSLGIWSLDGVPSRTNTIRLQVFDTQGNVGEANVTVNVVAPNLAPQTYALGPDGVTITNDAVTIYLSGTDDSTLSESLEYSWNLNGRGWSAFSANPIVNLLGLGSGTNVFRVRARDSAGFADPTPAIVTFVGTVEHAPDTPMNLYPFSGQTNVPMPTMLIASVFSDTDPASVFSRSQFQVRADAGSFGSPLWDSGEMSSATTTTQIPDSILAEKAKYWWHARYQDNTGRWSAWSAETAFTTGDMPPRLEIQMASGQVVLAWPTNSVGFRLEWTANLAVSSSWTEVSPGPVVVEEKNIVTNGLSERSKFYRLRKP